VINEFIYKTVNTCSSVFVMSADTAIEEFKKTFHINTDVSDVNFRKLNVEPYNSLEQNHQFGEKICLLYQIELIVFNIEIHLRILSFKYVRLCNVFKLFCNISFQEDHVEVLKLEIKVLNDLLAREIAACKNFLQRKRVMNLTFEVLIKFAQLFEMRRLICQTVFRKQTNVTTITDDTGIIVKCCSDDRKVKYLELNWTISWNVEQYEVSDFIEFYFNYSGKFHSIKSVINSTLFISFKTGRRRQNQAKTVDFGGAHFRLPPKIEVVEVVDGRFVRLRPQEANLQKNQRENDRRAGNL
jgi:hypothetical protein